jgi:PilZ domain
MPAQIVMVWIEDATGMIARGHAESVSARGACVRLVDPPPFAEGAEVAVRVCFDREAPTVAVGGRVIAIREADDALLCDVQWTRPAERSFEPWSAHAA